jgi:hypothetical protein
MKKLNVFKNCLLMILSLVCFIGCNKNDNEEKTLIGTWQGVSQKTYEKDKETGAISNESMEYFTDDYLLTYVFKEGGIFETNESNGSLIGSWTYEGNRLSTVLTIPDLDIEERTNYEVKLSVSELILSNSEDRGTYARYFETAFKRVK